MFATQPSLYNRCSTLVLVTLLSANAPLHASEDSDSAVPKFTVELGAGYADDDDPAFRKFILQSGHDSFAIFNFNAKKVPFWESGETRYWSASGKDLGTDSLELSFSVGDYGYQQFNFSYSEITKSGLSDAQTIFVNPGSNSLNLPANWTAATTTAGMSGLASPQNEFDDELQRRRIALNYKIKANANWAFDISFKHEIKDGSVYKYGIIGNTGGNPRSVALPRPVDFEFNDFSLRAEYTATTYNWQFGYDLSLFKNDHQSLSWDNPFLAINGWNSAAGYNTGRGSMALEPDNTYQQLFVTGFLRISATTSVNSSIQYAILEQDETFQAYSINPALSVSTPLPQDSLNGQIDIWRYKLGYQQALSKRLMLRANAAYEDRNNKTPQNLYVYIGGDSQDQDSATSSRARYNLPHSYRETKLDATLRYRIGKTSTLSGGAKHKTVDRNYSETTSVTEDVGHIAFESRPMDRLQSYVRLSKEHRNPSNYRGDTPYLNSHTQAYIANQAADERFENHPLLRKYYQAQRERQKMALGLNWTPSDIANVGLAYNMAQDDYTKSIFGLQKSDVRGLHFDLSLIKTDFAQWHNFISYEQYQAQQSGRSFNGNAIATHSIDPNRNWWHRNEDTVKTVGSDLEVFNILPNTDLSLGYLMAYSDSDFETTTGSALNALAMPKQGDKLRRISAELSHHYRKNIDITLNVVHESYRARNFSFDQVFANTMNNVIAIGNTTPNYSAVEAILAFKYHF
ncbi:MtrB/PioB family decaheme-associated outer membrane protein [Zhongshania sp.]|uniref:MtrB/PioB family decaheme-associated outer membrane protein n=2 Tax=Zhongshania sp. TaxID=1971902 RepID=UPI00356B5221